MSFNNSIHSMRNGQTKINGGRGARLSANALRDLITLQTYLKGLIASRLAGQTPALIGHDVHKMVKFALRNPKLEFRNPKQIQNPNFQTTKMRRL